MPHKSCTGIDIATRKVYQGSGVLNGEYPQVAGRIPFTPPLDYGVA